VPLLEEHIEKERARRKESEQKMLMMQEEFKKQ